MLCIGPVGSLKIFCSYCMGPVGSMKIICSCCIGPVGSLKTFWSSDSTWSSALEASGWPRLVAGCLKVASKIVRAMLGKQTLSVALRGNGGVVPHLHQL